MSGNRIYRFNIIPESFQKEEGKKAFKVTILAEDEKGTKDEFTFVLKDITVICIVSAAAKILELTQSN